MNHVKLSLNCIMDPVFPTLILLLKQKIIHPTNDVNRPSSEQGDLEKGELENQGYRYWNCYVCSY